MFSLAHTVRLVSVSFRSRAVAKRAMSYPFFLRVLICRRCHLWDEMSLGKDNNGREMMMRMRLVASALKATSSLDRQRQAPADRQVDPRGLGIAPREARSLVRQGRKIRRIMMIARGLKLLFLPGIFDCVIACAFPIRRKRIADALTILLNGARTKKSPREPFFSFLTQRQTLKAPRPRTWRKDVLQEGARRYLW